MGTGSVRSSSNVADPPIIAAQRVAELNRERLLDRVGHAFVVQVQVLEIGAEHQSAMFAVVVLGGGAGRRLTIDSSLERQLQRACFARRRPIGDGESTVPIDGDRIVEVRDGFADAADFDDDVTVLMVEP